MASLESLVVMPHGDSLDPGVSSMKDAAARPRSMAPKEHGAWGQLGFPLVVALGLGRPRLVAFGFAFAAVATFMAHEPVVVLLGQRGTRAVRESASPATRRLMALLSVAAVFGGGAVLAASWMVRTAALASLVLAMVAFLGFLVKGQERSTLGEVWIAWTLPAAALPVALSAGVSLSNALASWISFALAYTAGVYGVRGIIQYYRSDTASAGWLGLLGVLSGILALSVPSHQAAAAALVFWMAVVGCRLARPSPKSLKRVGWLLVGSSVAQAAWLLVAMRFAG